MNWNAIAAVAELLGAIGVILSLVYLASQVRSSGNRAKQAAIQSVVNQMNTVWTQMSSERKHAELWVRGTKGISNLDDEADRVQYSALMMTLFRPFEEIFQYRAQGLVDDWSWQSISQQCHAFMGTPGFADWWQNRGDWFSLEFQKYVKERQQDLQEYNRWSDQGSSPTT